MNHEDEVALGVDELTDRQIAITTLKRLDAHTRWMEHFMTNLAPEFADLTNAVTAVLSAFQGESSTISAQLAQIADLNAQIATITAQETTDAASAATALAQVADLNAQIATLTQTATDQATAAETAATALNAALPAAATPPAATSDGGSTTTTGGATPPPAPALPQYTYDGDPSAAIDPAWTATGASTPDGQALYTYSADTAGLPATGDGLGGVWHLYNPPVVA